MTVSLVSTTATLDTYEQLLAAMWENGIYLHSAVDMVVPFDFYGAEFTLVVSTTGEPITITVSRTNDSGLEDLRPISTLRVIPKHKVEQVRLPLTSGVNIVTLTSDIGNVSLRVGCARWATALYVQAQDAEDNVVLRLEDRENTVLSPTGSLLVERWFGGYADLLPRVNSLHRLAMRLLIDGFARPTSGLGARKVASGISGSTPLIEPLLGDAELFDAPSPCYTLPEEFAGYDWHVWVPNMATAVFVAAGKYMENLPALWQIDSFSETLIAFQRIDEATGSPDGEQRLLRNFEDEPDTSVEDYILASGCFDRIRPWVRFVQTTEFVICLTQYPFDTQVETCYALGTVYFDCSILTMEATITDPDYVDPEDPTGDGWVGKDLSGRWDYEYGGNFDSTTQELEEFVASQIDCIYQNGPVVTPLMTTRFDSTITETITAFGSLLIRNVPGPIIGPGV